MKTDKSIFYLLVTAGFSIILMSGCGDSGDTLECGPNTNEVNGECRGATLECGEDTKRLDNRCVSESEPITCADGAELEDGKCVPKVECGPDTSPDASGKCVPKFEEITCGEGTKKEGSKCVEKIFTIDSVKYPEEIKAADNEGGNLKTIEVNWSGEVSPPLEARILFDQDCSENKTCRVKKYESLESNNPIELPEALGCWGDFDSEWKVELLLILEDSNGKTSTPANVDWTCIP